MYSDRRQKSEDLLTSVFRLLSNISVKVLKRLIRWNKVIEGMVHETSDFGLPTSDLLNTNY